MDLTFLGHSSFRLKGKTGSVVIDPFDPQMVGLKFPKIDADIVTVSHAHTDHNKIDLVTNVKKVVEGPGEYEILGISIIGIQSFHDAKKGEERGKNTIFVYEIDGLRLCHLGDLGHTLGESTLDAIGRIDVLMVPVGGFYTIGPTEAVDVVQAVEPSNIIPMHYKMDGLNPELADKLTPVEDFIKALGITSEVLPKLSLNKDLLSEEEQKVYILEKK